LLKISSRGIFNKESMTSNYQESKSEEYNKYLYEKNYILNDPTIS